MRMHTSYKVLYSLAFAAALAGCGGGTPAAEQAEESAQKSENDESEGASEEKKDGDKSASGEDEAEAKDDKKKDKDDKDDEAPSTAGPKFERTPKDILLAPEVVFMFSFNDSDPKKEAEEKCSKTAKDDPKKQNECLAKARKKFDNADGFRFEKDDKDTWWWHTVRKQGAKLVSVHKIPVEIEEKEKSVVLKPSGRDKGTKPWANPPKQVVFDVPNDYQITQDDPKHGKLVYEAKVGILGDGSKDPR